MLVTFFSVPIELSSRPLTGAPSDTARYVRRPFDERVDRALGLGLNILLSAPRGFGATSLLFRIETELDGGAVYLPVPPDATAASDVLNLLAGRLGFFRPDDEQTSLGDLRSVLEREGATQHAPWRVLVDGPMPSPAAHQLFGGYRDALFALPLRWVVVAPAEWLGEYQMPPADVFFEAVIHLDGLSADGLHALIDRRDVSLDDARFREVVALSGGSPRRALALVRQAVLEPDASLNDQGYQEWLERQAELSQSASALFEEMTGHGPVTIADRELRERLGWGEMRVRRAMQELVEGGLVRASQGRRDGPGRPPAVYQVAPGPPGRTGTE